MLGGTQLKMFFELFVEQIAGSAWMAVVLGGLFFAVIGMFGKMSFFLLGTLLALYLLVMGTLFGGIVVWLPIMLVSLIYLGNQIWKFTQE